MKCLYAGNSFEPIRLTDADSISDDLLIEISNRQDLGAVREDETARADRSQPPRQAETETRFMSLLTRYLEAFAPDVVHFDNPGFPDMEAALVTAKEAGAAVVVSLQDVAAGESGVYEPNRTEPLAAWYSGQNIGRRAGDRSEHFKILKTRAIGQCLARSKPADRYIAPSYDFQSWLMAAGMDADKIDVMPVAVMPPATMVTPKPRRPYALFAGRLTPDSGIRTILDAWKFADTLGLRLVVAGDGPLAPEVQASGAKILHLAGPRTHGQLDYLMRRASCFLAPTGAGAAQVIARAFANGLPVIAADTRVAAEMIDSGRTGYLYRNGDPLFVGAAIRHAYESSEALRTMGDAASEEFRRRFSPAILRRKLAAIYQETVETSHGQRSPVARRTVTC